MQEPILTDAFWCITLGFWAIRSWWKHRPSKMVEDEPPAKNETTKEEKVQKEVEDRRKQEIDELRKQGYSDKVIAIILPQLYDGQ